MLIICMNSIKKKFYYQGYSTLLKFKVTMVSAKYRCAYQKKILVILKNRNLKGFLKMKIPKF